MAILTAETHLGHDVFDATGVMLRECQWCDTETGEAVHYVFDDQGFVWAVNDAGDLVAKTEWRQHPAPLRVERLE